MTSLTIKGIVSFPEVFNPKSVNGGRPRYGVSCLIDRADPQYVQLKAAFDALKAADFPKGLSPTADVCLMDCVSMPIYASDARLANYAVVKMYARAESKPHVVDMNRAPVLDPALVYPGCIAWFAFNLYSYKDKPGSGISAGFNGLMITGEEGPLGRLDNKPTAEAMFAGIGAASFAAPISPAPAAPAPAAPAPAAPAPAAPAPAAPVSFAAPVHRMSPAADGVTYEQYIQAGWTDAQLVQAGLLLLQ